MKKLHTLKVRWFLAAMVLAVTIGETIAWQVSRSFSVRFDPAAVGAICVGVVAVVVSAIYDGRD